MLTTSVAKVQNRTATCEWAGEPPPSCWRPFRYDVAVLGLGYVGLPMALALRGTGRSVVGIDISRRRIDAIERQGVDLADSDRDRLRAALADPTSFELTTASQSIAEAAVVLICVPTPINDHQTPNLSPLTVACDAVVENARPGQLIVLTSTTYVGCTRSMLGAELMNRGMIPGRDIYLASAPERIDPGNQRGRVAEIPRVIGGMTRACVDRAIEALAGCTGTLHTVSNLETAEMTKLLENTFRAVNISFVNEFADISRSFGVDITEVITAASTKPFGFTRFWPGPGIGGHCIPCDPHYLLWQLRAKRISAPVIETTMAAVAQRPLAVVRRAGEVLAGCGIAVAGASVLVVGVAYKPAVSDVRESPALEIISRLRDLGASIAYSDQLVPVLRLGNASWNSVPDPEKRAWDLVIVHTLHPDTELSWLTNQRLVLDATYRLPGQVAHHLV